MMNRLRFTRIRDVKSPSRNHDGDAGLDFFIPIDLTLSQLQAANAKSEIEIVNGENLVESAQLCCSQPRVTVWLNENGYIESIGLSPLARVLIPSGIRVLIDPKYSMLTAANKSGLATKHGLIFTAQVVDSPYTGEVHIGVVNLGGGVTLVAGQKVTQFIHVPIYHDILEEISNEIYEQIAMDWGTRGNNGFGSGDNVKSETDNIWT